MHNALCIWIGITPLLVCPEFLFALDLCVVVGGESMRGNNMPRPDYKVTPDPIPDLIVIVVLEITDFENAVT